MRDGGRHGCGIAEQRAEVICYGCAETLRRVKQTEHGGKEAKDRDAYKRHGHSETDIVAVIQTPEKREYTSHINVPTYTK